LKKRPSLGSKRYARWELTLRERGKRGSHLEVDDEAAGTKKGHPRKEIALYFGKISKAFISTLYVLVAVRTSGVIRPPPESA